MNHCQARQVYENHRSQHSAVNNPFESNNLESDIWTKSTQTEGDLRKILARKGNETTAHTNACLLNNVTNDYPSHTFDFDLLTSDAVVQIPYTPLANRQHTVH